MRRQKAYILIDVGNACDYALYKAVALLYNMEVVRWKEGDGLFIFSSGLIEGAEQDLKL